MTVARRAEEMLIICVSNRLEKLEAEIGNMHSKSCGTTKFTMKTENRTGLQMRPRI
jgi:hypothetical protein